MQIQLIREHAQDHHHADRAGFDPTQASVVAPSGNDNRRVLATIKYLES
jgi:hypothetical protein